MKVILVEDEPSALRYLRSTLELRCAGCEVVATAENGTEGLKRVRQLRPDLVITDIRMAGMDGIQLAERLRKEFPEIYSVIVSGYQDFNYARGALHSGVADYLLKPVRAAELKAVIEKIGARVRQDVYGMRVAILRSALGGVPVDAWKIGKYLPFDRLFTALLRFGGLPSRFGATIGNANVDPGSSAPGSQELIEQDAWACPGRDDRETVFFCAEELTRPASFRRAVASVREKGHGFSTLVFGPGACRLDGCAPQVTVLRHVLDCMIVPGLSQTHQLEGTPPAGRRVPETVLDPSRDSRIDFLLSNASYAGLESELRELAGEWERDRRPIVATEAALRQVLLRVVKTSGNPGGVPPDEIEFLLDSLLSQVSTYEDLGSGAWGIVQQVLGTGGAIRREADVPSLHAAIVRYVEQSCTQPLTLQSVCDKFRVSQTTVSRLFRRFEGASFIEYLTRRRVNMAKRLIGEHPEMPLKDVAAYVGYHDQFYFSRVFKSLTGVPPSEWTDGRHDD
jgi:two-component system response regulator YesN